MPKGTEAPEPFGSVLSEKDERRLEKARLVTTNAPSSTYSSGFPAAWPDCAAAARALR